MTFSGGITHSSTGALPNGSTGYGKTFISPVTDLTVRDTHISYYSRTNQSGAVAEIGSVEQYDGDFNPSIQLVLRYSDGNFYSDAYTNTSNRIAVANANSKGFYISTRTSISNHRAFKDGVQMGSTDTTNETENRLQSEIISIFAIQFGLTVNQFSSKECAFSSIGSGLTVSESLEFYNIIQAFQTTLGREV